MRLGAVALIVPDYDAAIAFFVEGLGWTLTADEPQGPKRWVTVSDGAVGIVLACADGPEQRAAIGAQWALHTCDSARAAARIEAAGGTFEEAPRSEPSGTVAV